MKKISLIQFDEAYALFQEAFDIAELRPYEQMKEMFLEGLFVIYGYYESQKLLGALIVWELERCVYLENFAVSEKSRGKGLGGFLLQEFSKIYNGHFLFLEVEEPVCDITKRRIEFYKRNGYILNPYHYVQPSFRENDSSVHLTFMTYPSCMSEKQFEDIKEEIFRVVYRKGVL